MGIIESVQSYDLNIPAGGAQNIDVAGDRVQFLSAVDPFAQIEIRPNYAQGNISLRPGQGFRFSEQVTRWIVFNRGTVPLSGYLLIGSGDFFDQRISGEVSIIDGSKARTLANSAFGAFVNWAAAAGKYTRLQLWNPVGSGKRLNVECVSLSTLAATNMYVTASAAPLATINGYGQSKLMGGASSVAYTNYEDNVAAGLAASAIAAFSLGAGAGQIFVPHQPFVVPPGFGLMVSNNVTAANMSANFEWYEESI